MCKYEDTIDDNVDGNTCSNVDCNACSNADCNACSNVDCNACSNADCNIEGNTEAKCMNVENQEKDRQLAEEQFVREMMRIYDELRNGDLQNEIYNGVIFAGNFINKFKEKNVNIEDITIDLIDKLKDNRNYPLWHILACVRSIHEFYEPGLSDKYVVVCYVDNEEIMYCKAEIIGNIDELDLCRKDLEICDIEKIVDLDNDVFIDIEDLSEYHGINKVLKAMNIIRKEFPGGTRFVSINI